MTKHPRLRLDGATYFFTVRLRDRSATALVDHIGLLRFAYAKTMMELPVRCDAMVILPDHLHAIWTLPAEDADHAERWHRIMARFVQQLPRKRDAGIWQTRFREHFVLGADELLALTEYCLVDPARHGLVSNPSDWPYSSFAKLANGRGTALALA